MCASLADGCKLADDSSGPTMLNGDEAIQLIDSMRPNGSFEAAHERLTGTAREIATRIAAATPGQTWRFEDDPHGLEAKRQGLPCEKLTGDIARRPMADPVVFGRTFSPEEFSVARDIVRDAASAFGATVQSSLFNDQVKRDYMATGNGYEFKLGQITYATLEATGECALMQRVVDLPAGQLPPEPPLEAPTTP